MHKEKEKSFSVNTALKVYYSRDAEIDSKNTVFIRGNGTNPLWRDVAYSEFLQIAWFPPASSRLCSVSQKKQFLQFHRVHPGAALFHNHGASSHQQDGHSPIQRFILEDAWFEAVSRPVHDPPVSQAATARHDSTTGAVARQSQSASFSFSTSAARTDIRFGLYGYSHLRGAAERGCWIQSEKARTTILSSIIVFRGEFSGVLAWQSSSREHGGHDRGNTVHKALSGESALHNREKSDTVSYGFWFLLQTNCRLSGCHGLWVRHCGERIQTRQACCVYLPFSGVEQWLGSRGISRENPFPGQKRTPIRCGKTTDTFRRGGRPAIDVVQAPKICLPCFRDQSATQSLARVPVLQSSCNHREEHPGTHVRLSAGQDTNRRLDRQRGVLPVGSVCGKYRSLVQTPVFARRIPRGDTRYDTDGLSRSSCPFDQSAGEKYRQAPRRLPLSKGISSGIQNNRRVTATGKFSNLQKIRQVSLYEKQEKIGVFTHF